MESLVPSENNIMKNEGISKSPIPSQPKAEDVDPSESKGNLSESKDELHDRVDGAGKEVDEIDKENLNADNTNPDQPHWRGRNCNLLNDDLSFFGKAKIVVCFLHKSFNEKNLRDIEADVLCFGHN